MSDNAIYLRAYAAVNDDSAADAVRQALNVKLSGHGEITRCDTPKPYWKISGYWEVFLELRPTKAVAEAFDPILIDLGSGWEVHRFKSGGSWAVWNSGSNSICAIPDVRWMNLECFQADWSAVE